jgi:uroporphyrinogen decarboxylase
MTYRERFGATLAHLPVDRPPMDLGATDMTEIEGGPRRLAHLMGVPGDGPDPDEAVLQALDIDIRGIGGVLAPDSPLARRASDGEFTDCWGIGYRWTGFHWEIVTHPLGGASIADLADYPWPGPDRVEPGTIERIGALARHLREDTPYVVCARHPVLGVMELGCWMCGFDDFLGRMAAEPDFVHRFFEIVLGYQRAVCACYYKAVGRWAHFTTSGDDFGTQAAPFISPRMFADLVVPYMADRIAWTRRYTDAVFFHHTCGAVRPLIPHLIAMGVDILNPIQPLAAGMEPEGLKASFGDDLTFYGGVDTQDLLPNGSPEEVRAETRRLVRVLGRNGGYVLSPAHCLLQQVPEANIVAMYDEGARRARG